MSRFVRTRDISELAHGFDYVRNLLIEEDLEDTVQGVFNLFLGREKEYREFFYSLDSAMGSVEQAFGILNDRQLKLKKGGLKISVTNRPAKEQGIDIGAVFFESYFNVALEGHRFMPGNRVYSRAGISNAPLGSPHVSGEIRFSETDVLSKYNHILSDGTTKDSINHLPTAHKPDIYRILSAKLLQSG